MSNKENESGIIGHFSVALGLSYLRFLAFAAVKS